MIRSYWFIIILFFTFHDFSLFLYAYISLFITFYFYIVAYSELIGEYYRGYDIFYLFGLYLYVYYGYVTFYRFELIFQNLIGLGYGLNILK